MKDFDRMEVMTEKISHNNARVLESFQLHDDLDIGLIKGIVKRTDYIHDQFKSIGMLNKNRGRLKSRWENSVIPKHLLSKKPLQIFE